MKLYGFDDALMSGIVLCCVNVALIFGAIAVLIIIFEAIRRAVNK